MLTRLTTVLCLTLMLGGCGTMTFGFADKARTSAAVARAPRVTPPTEAVTPCRLYVLPAAPTNDDLKVGYATRGADLVACDGKRRLALATVQEQLNALDAWEMARAKRRCAWWKLGLCRPPD